MSNPKFHLGMLVATPGAIAEAEEHHVDFELLLRRHLRGDWGNLGIEDKKLNNDALIYGNRIMSAYVEDGVKFWIITEADRSVTTILLPEEY